MVASGVRRGDCRRGDWFSLADHAAADRSVRVDVRGEQDPLRSSCVVDLCSRVSRGLVCRRSVFHSSPWRRIRNGGRRACAALRMGRPFDWAPRRTDEGDRYFLARRLGSRSYVRLGDGSRTRQMVGLSVAGHDRNRRPDGFGAEPVSVVPTSDVEKRVADCVHLGCGTFDIATGGDSLDIDRRGSELVARPT